jgi:hypothetical protein
MTVAAACHLLFGLLAYQNGLIDQGAGPAGDLPAVGANLDQGLQSPVKSGWPRSV